MDHVVHSDEALHALELRVLEGPQAGARAPFAGASCELAAAPEGKGDGADIILREEVAPARVRITVESGAEPPQARIDVLHGEVRLGDQVHGAGAQARWTAYAPLQIGRSEIAFGSSALDAWPVTTMPAASAEARAAAAHPAIRTPLRKRAEVWLAGAGAAVLAMCAAALWTAHLSAAPRPAQAAAEPALVTALRGSEFSALQAIVQPDGHIELRGRLATVAERTRLDAWLAAHQLTPRVEVQVDEVLARDVTEVFRVNGVAVQARVVSPGRVVAEAAERDTDRLARAEEVVRRDVRGLTQLTLRNTAKPLPSPTPPVTDDPGKRIASLVPGEPGYLVTADGSRYFVGALLPTGHRITQIASGHVTLEYHGEQSTLNF
jgi:type III secretion protein D